MMQLNHALERVAARYRVPILYYQSDPGQHTEATLILRDGEPYAVTATRSHSPRYIRRLITQQRPDEQTQPHRWQVKPIR